MYIAFKWLVCLVLAMWLAMCSKDVMLNKIKKVRAPGKEMKYEFIFKNVTEFKSSKIASQVKINHIEEQNMTALHVTIFIAGALAVSVLNKKNEIIIFTRSKVAEINIRSASKTCAGNLKTAAFKIGVTLSLCFFTLWKKMKHSTWKTIDYLRMNTLKASKSFRQHTLYKTMLSKLREMGDERKNLGKLLISAIQENKNIRMQYQLETLAKNRLVQHIENTRKQIKENSSRYMSFRHLYLITHQENMFLKGRIVKLTKEKAAVEKNLLELLSEIYKTKNNELKAHCCRYIVKTKHNLLNSDVTEEIKKFLNKTKCQTNIDTSWPVCSSPIQEEDNILSLISDAPKLKGLPGEIVWTVKDKNGIIEKLYEYDYESDFDSGDTIRRIRQYSVYYDKDCLLDFANSITEKEVVSGEDRRSCFLRVEHPLGSPRIVSGSEAFKRFLRGHKSAATTSTSQ